MNFIRRKRTAIVLWIILILFCSGCGAKMEKMQISTADEQLQPDEQFQTEEQIQINGQIQTEEQIQINGQIQTEEQMQIDGQIQTEEQFQPEEPFQTEEQFQPQGQIQTEEQFQPEEKRYTEDVNAVKEKNETESIQDEIAKIEVKSYAYENADWSSMGQQEMNQLTAQWYQLWDDELNSLWSRLSDALDAETKAKVLEEQRAWIKRKEENVKAAGAAAFGGSLQPQLENSAAEEMTRARVYILAGYLADVRNESFTVPSEIQESIDMADPSLDDVFKKFEGQWVFDERRGACVGVERTETCAYGVEGSHWTVWITGGDLFSDLNVYGYTGNRILFKIPHDGYDAYYELSFNMANAVCLAFGTSIDAMDDVIVCD